MASASQRSSFETFQIIKNGKVVDISGNGPSATKATTFDYYESILSPNVTAILTVADTASSVIYDSKYDRQERLGTLSSALPLTGDVFVRFKIATKYGTLNFLNTPLIFDKEIIPNQESNREGIILNLFSGYSKATQLPIKTKYTGNITNSVRRLLKDYLKVPEEKIFTSPCRNSMSFHGCNESLYKVLCEKVAPKTVPARGNPGYFFYETQDGFNFRAIDDLIAQEPVASYYKNEVLKANLDNDDNDFKILTKTDVKRDDLITSIKSGLYVSRNIFWNPLTSEYTEKTFRLEGLEFSLGGGDIDIPNLESYARTHFHILDVGGSDPGIGYEVNNNPQEWVAKSTMRYNSLFSQIIQVTVPCNLRLRAGNVINCDFEIITQESKSEGSIDETQSGKYLIANLSHHFDALRSYTAMTLVRDSYGRRTKGD